MSNPGLLGPKLTLLTKGPLSRPSVSIKVDAIIHIDNFFNHINLFQTQEWVRVAALFKILRVLSFQPKVMTIYHNAVYLPLFHKAQTLCDLD